MRRDESIVEKEDEWIRVERVGEIVAWRVSDEASTGMVA